MPVISQHRLTWCNAEIGMTLSISRRTVCHSYALVVICQSFNVHWLTICSIYTFASKNFSQSRRRRHRSLIACTLHVPEAVNVCQLSLVVWCCVFLWLHTGCKCVLMTVYRVVGPCQVATRAWCVVSSTSICSVWLAVIDAVVSAGRCTSKFRSLPVFPPVRWCFSL